MEKIKIAAANAKSYDADEMKKAVSKLFDDLGGIEKYIPQNSKVFVKANLVRDMAPEKAGTTHPAVLVALVKLIEEKCNAKVTVGDSSGGAYTKSYMSAVYSKCRMTEVAAETKAELNADFEYTKVKTDGRVIQSIDIINSFLSADVVINAAKLKAHSFAGYTGAVKNMFGLVPGLVKVELHSRFPDLGEFCDLLIDIERLAAPKTALHLIDAVIGMEGTGPTNGRPKFLGKLIASTDAYAADIAAVSLFEEPFETPLLKKAKERGLADASLTSYDFDFADWKNSFDAHFDTVKVISANTFLNMPKWIKRLLKKNLTQKVKIERKICRGCGKCAVHCPAKAIRMIAGKANIGEYKCIRCYCCQELCPFDAVKFKKPLVYRVVRRASHTKNIVNKK